MAITAVTGFTESFTDIHPFYRGTYFRVVSRSATETGNGTSEIAYANVQRRLSQLTDFSFPYRFGGRFYLGEKIPDTVDRTAVGSGDGSGSAQFSLIAKRTATGSGVGSSSVSILKKVRRTANDAAIPFRTNLVPNPSFESGASDWLALNSATIAQSNAQAWVGSYSLSVTTSTTFFSGISTDYIPATAGVRYTVSWYARSATGSVGSMRPALLAFNSSNTQLTSGISFSRTFTTTWTRFSMSLTAPANTASLKFRLDNTQNVGNLVFYVDGVLLEAADSAGTYIEGTVGANAPTGSSSTSELVIASRTATGSGTGTSTTEASFYSIVSVTATGSGVGSGVGYALNIRTAVGDGLGSSVADGLRIVPRTADSTGSGSSSSAENLFTPRTATGSGAGTSDATELHIAPRTGTGSGAGTSSTVSVFIAFRTATGSGTGTAVVVAARFWQRQATGSGQATGLADWVKSHIFRVPYTETYPAGYFGGGDSANRLRRYDRSNIRTLNLYKLNDGTYTTIEQRDLGQVVKLWHGGRDHFLNDAEVVELTEAGFGASIT